MGLTSCTCRLMRRHWLSGPASYKIYMGSFIYCFTKKKKTNYIYDELPSNNENDNERLPSNIYFRFYFSFRDT